ncbi:MAG: hypothetical protein Q8K98_00670 [Bacteroidota bacterium]|nr:hypothetical protein [Bacteroidota bacterium]
MCDISKRGKGLKCRWTCPPTCPLKRSASGSTESIRDVGGFIIH